MSSEEKFSFFNFASGEYVAEHGRLILMAIPLLASNLTMCIAKLVDEGFVGQLSVVELAAVTASYAWLGICAAPIGGLLMALGSLTAQAVGAKDYTMVNGLLFAGMTWSFGLFYLPVSFLWWMLGPMFRVLIRHHTNLFYTSVTIYTRLRAIALVPLLVNALLSIWIQCQGYLLVISVLGACNVAVAAILKYMFILGKWGLPSFGVGGAPGVDIFVGTLQAIALTMTISCTPDLARVVDFNNKGSALNWKAFKRFFSLAGPVTLTSLGDTVATLATTMYATKIWEGDAHKLALVGVLVSAESVITSFSSAVGQAGMLRVAHSFGNSDPKELRRALCVCLEQSLALGCILSLMVVIFRNDISVLYTSEPSLQREAAAYFPVLCITCTANSILYPLLYSIDAIGLPSKNAVCMLTGTLLVGIPAQALFGLWLFKADPILGLWLGNASGSITTLSMGAWVFYTCDLPALMKEAAFHRKNTIVPSTVEPKETDSLLGETEAPTVDGSAGDSHI